MQGMLDEQNLDTIGIDQRLLRETAD